MTDREDCPPIALRPEDHVLRATCLARFETEEERQAVVVLGQMLVQLQNETRQWASGTDTIAGKLEAVATDLQQLADYLAMVGGERREFCLEADEDRLALRADRWALELITLAETIRREVRPPAEPVH